MLNGIEVSQDPSSGDGWSYDGVELALKVKTGTTRSVSKVVVKMCSSG